ncbi:MAG: DUF4349 domain-containing protein [Gaiellaceae bacterium]
MKKLLALIPLTVLLALVAGACSSGGGGSDQSAGAGGGGTAPGSVTARDKGVVSSGGSVGADEVLGTPASASLPEMGPQIVQNASIRLSVSRGRFDGKVDEARSVAASLGGFVVSSSASQGSDRRLVRGTLVLRVPARSYADAMQRLRRLGKVEALDESGQDVSQEFVDLRARVRQLRAVESQLLELLGRANDVPAALAVQSQLAQVQLDLEQARGRLQFLDDQVSFATISLTLHELGVGPARDGGGFGIVDAWAKAGAGFVAVIGWIFVGLAVASPVLVLLVLGLLVGRRLRRRLAQA